MIEKILLLIAAYLYRSNYPNATRQEVATGIIADLKEINIQLQNTDKSKIE